MINALRVRLRSELFLALLRTLVTRGITAMGQLALVVLLGRLYGAEGVGVFALAQGILLGAATLGRFGMNDAMMRYVGWHHQSPDSLRYLKWAVRRALWISLLAGSGIMLSRHAMEQIFVAEGLASMLVGIALAVPGFTLGFILSGFFKGIRRPATASLMENGALSLLAGFGVLALHWLGGEVPLAAIGWSFAVASWVLVAWGSWQVWRWHGAVMQKISQNNALDSAADATPKRFYVSSQSYFIMSLAELMQSVFSIMIAGWLLSSAELGMFKAAQQSGMLIAFILIVINAVLPPRFAELYLKGHMQELARLAQLGAWLGLLASAPLMLLCMVKPFWVLGLFGHEFEGAANILRLIAMAQMANVVIGSVGPLLNMTGNEILMRNVALLSNVTGLGFFCVLIPLLGVMGAAIALALTIMMQKLVELYFVRQRLGMTTLPTLRSVMHLHTMFRR